MRHTIATVCLTATLEHKLAAAAAAGFDGIELFEPDLTDSSMSARQVRRAAGELGLTIDLFQPLRDFEGVAAEQLHALAEHATARGTALDTIAEMPSHKLFFCQLADATDLAVDVLSWSRHHRCLPGQGAFDLVGFTARVLDAGYGGPLSLEVFSDAPRAADPDQVAGDARRSLAALEAQLRQRRPPAVAGQHDITEKRGRW